VAERGTVAWLGREVRRQRHRNHDMIAFTERKERKNIHFSKPTIEILLTTNYKTYSLLHLEELGNMGAILCFFFFFFLFLFKKKKGIHVRKYQVI
jgi:hypothetical protein